MSGALVQLQKALGLCVKHAVPVQWKMELNNNIQTQVSCPSCKSPALLAHDKAQVNAFFGCLWFLIVKARGLWLFSCPCECQLTTPLLLVVGV